jgi:hypothetical protein
MYILEVLQPHGRDQSKIIQPLSPQLKMSFRQGED